MPVVGPDVNSPGDPIKIPTSLIQTQNAILSGQRQIVTPTHGTITINFDPPGRTGTCSQCGSCCTHPVSACPMPPHECGYVLDTEYNVHKCQNLIIDSRKNSLGKAGRCSCAIRATILDGPKGCTLTPDHREPHMTSCTFAFDGE